MSADPTWLMRKLRIDTQMRILLIPALRTQLAEEADQSAVGAMNRPLQIACEGLSYLRRDQ